MPNRLANESSPYLLQHQHNPVDWYPWGEDALDRARAEHKPIFLSVGYSACHWCHVMERESFEDDATAALMNDLFVNIKVDREERPDIDGIYMNAVVAMTGSGGWPMSVFLTPDGKPFYGGTYFPPRARHGLPSFQDVLRGVHDAWTNRRDEVERVSDDLRSQLNRLSLLGVDPAADALQQETIDDALPVVWRGYDQQLHGWGRAPKFPQPMLIEFLLMQYRQRGDTLARDMALNTLRAMAEGGMYDQLGGGFHRYSTDARWLVPHFEKMMYDNAQLARACLHAWQLTGEPFYRRITEEICDYVLREMTDTNGGFYSTQDADSEGVEGKFFVWTPAETAALLGDDAPLFNAAYDITPGGNFEGKAIPHVVRSLPELATEFGLTEAAVNEKLAAARATLFAARSKRVWPGLDDKILTGWNGMMLAALAEAARVLGRDDYRAAAEANARFLLGTMRDADGRLFRTQRGDDPPRLMGYLEDYANLADGLLQLYQTTFDEAYFVAACELVDTVLAHFAAPDGGFYDTADDHETLITRPKDLQDNAVPSGNSVMAHVLLQLAALTGNGNYRDAAEGVLRPLQAAMRQYPSAFGRHLQALSFALGEAREVAIVGEPGDPATQALLAEAQRPYLPFQVVALKRPDAESRVALLDQRTVVRGLPAAYVCRGFFCDLPVTEPQALRARLAPQPHQAAGNGLPPA